MFLKAYFLYAKVGKINKLLYFEVDRRHLVDSQAVRN